MKVRRSLLDARVRAVTPTMMGLASLAGYLRDITEAISKVEDDEKQDGDTLPNKWLEESVGCPILSDLIRPTV